MTQDEMEAETLRYRAPAVAALDSGRFAVFTPGWDPAVRFVGILELRSIIISYTEWNVLDKPISRPRVRQGILELLDLVDASLTDEELTALELRK